MNTSLKISSAVFWMGAMPGSLCQERSSLDAWILGNFFICLVSLWLVFSIVDWGWGKRVLCCSRPPIQLRWDISISLDMGMNTLNFPGMVTGRNE